MPKIICLVRKDLILVQRYLWLIVIYAFIFSGFIQSNDSALLYGLLPGLLLILAIGTDMRLPNQQFLVSLPVKRNYLIFSKYASSFIFLILGIAVCLLMNMVTDLVDYGTLKINASLVIGTFISMTLFTSIYLPLYYWLGLKGAQFLNMAMMIIIMVSNGAVSSLLGSEDISRPLEWVSAHSLAASVLIASATALVVFISYQISLAIFRKKDL
ncbi:ABC-2 transporter permease [Paenibacillus vini]|uniref:Membrane protein n=1 Tax=Paenibacillus vini TaxID=1476024 RepID=A0ABQ4M8Q0_9BACL|nr:ABC-2 transporter permease [Paenibacillus vini]GIP52359.1 membrane protein [Paenibacillus vini]